MQQMEVDRFKKQLEEADRAILKELVEAREKYEQTRKTRKEQIDQ